LPSRASLGNGVDGIDDNIEAEEEVGDGKLMDHGVALDPNGPRVRWSAVSAASTCR
jgi:hypothetical protein